MQLTNDEAHLTLRHRLGLTKEEYAEHVGILRRQWKYHTPLLEYITEGERQRVLRTRAFPTAKECYQEFHTTAHILREHERGVLTHHEIREFLDTQEVNVELDLEVPVQ